MFAKRNEFILMCEEKKRKGKANTSSIFTQRKQRENKIGFTRMKMKNKIHFPCVKMRKKRSYKERGESIKGEVKERVISISETAKREGSNRNNESEPRNP